MRDELPPAIAYWSATLYDAKEDSVGKFSEQESPADVARSDLPKATDQPEQF
jgi:hypothetical protein